MNEKRELIKTLTKKEEDLLLQYSDGECGLWNRRRAEALISRSDEARQFVREAKELARATRAVLRAEAGDHEPDLWTAIERRIAQEEHAAFYLGARRLRQDKSRPAASAGFFWGASGAAVAAALVVAVLVQPAGIRSGAGPQPTAVAGRQAAPPLYMKDAEAPQVGLVSEGYQPPRMRVESPMELDWLRSQGRVSMIPGPSRRAPIIWINRHGRLYPQRSAAPTGNPIRMVEDDAPMALPAVK